MPSPYIGPGWEHPERKKMEIGGSLADFYVHDGFTVASIVEAGFIDRKRVEARRDIAIFSPVDDTHTTPMTWVPDLDTAEKYIAAQRAQHPEWPTVPVPLSVMVPRYEGWHSAREKVREIVGVLEAREEIRLHGYNVWRAAVLLFTYCQRTYINQESVDRALEFETVRTELLKGVE